MANELKVSVAADATALGPGMDAAEQKVVSSAATMAQAQNLAAAAARNLAEAQAQLGAAAAGGNAKAASVIADYAAADAAAAAALEQLTAAAQANIPVMAEQAAATGAAAAATNLLGVSARQGAAAGIGILEGRMMSGNRAAAAFLSTTLGLGPVLQAAFPIIGALALGEVLVDIGKNAYEAYEKFVSIDAVWDKLADDVRKMQTADFINVHSIETATERLEKANEAASALRDTAEQLHKTGFQHLVSAALTGNLGGLAAAAGQLTAGHGAAEASAQRTKESIALQSKQIEDQHQLNDLKIEAAHAADGALSPEQKITAEYAKRVSLAREEQRFNEQRDRLLGNATPRDAGQQQLQLAESAAGGEAYAQRVELNKRAVAEFVSESIADYKRLEAESKEITAAVTAAWDESNKADVEAQRKAEEADRQHAEEFRRNRQEMEAQGRSEAQVEIEAANATFSSTQQDIRMREQLGLVSHRVALQMILDAEKLKESQIQGALGKQAGLYDPIEGGRELQEFTAVEAKMTEEAQKAAAERERITDQETARYLQAWRSASTEFTRDFTQAFNSVITRQDSTEKAFGAMLGRMELQVIDFAAKTVLEHALMWLELQVLSATGNATLLVQQQATAAAQKLSDAKTAASNAYAWGSAWGGPPAGAVAAAIAFTAVEAFEAGGIVGGSGGAPMPIIAHAGERVLSAGQTNNFENLVNQGGSRSATLHQENHFGGGVTQEMLNESNARGMAQLRSMIRPEALL